MDIETHRWATPRAAQTSTMSFGAVALIASVTGDPLMFGVGLAVAVICCAAIAAMHWAELRALLSGKVRQPNLILPIGAVIVTVVVGVIGGWRVSHPPAETLQIAKLDQIEADVHRPRIQEAESDSLQAIDAFLCSNDESVLVNKFDIENIFDKNIDLIKKYHGPLTASQSTSVTGAIFSLDHLHFTKPVVRGGQYVGGRDWIINPGEIGYIVTTPKYRDQMAKLSEFSHLASVPSNIRAGLEQVSSDVGFNMTGMIQELNLAYKSDPRFIFEARNGRSTRYFAVVHNTYFTKMRPIRPSVDRLCAIISSHFSDNSP